MVKGNKRCGKRMKKAHKSRFRKSRWGSPQSSILMGCSMINHLFMGYPHFKKPPWMNYLRQVSRQVDSATLGSRDVYISVDSPISRMGMFHCYVTLPEGKLFFFPMVFLWNVPFSYGFPIGKFTIHYVIQ